MAFTRKFLSAMGIEAEKIDEIINAHVEVVNSLKEERDDYKKDAEMLADVQKQLNEANEKLAKNGDGETVLKKDFETLKKEYDDYKATVVEKETLTAKETAYRELLKAAGVSEKRHGTILKVTDLSKIEIDNDGKIKDADKRTEDIKTEWADFVEKVITKGANTANPPSNNGNGTGKTKEEILAIKDGTLRRQEMLNNPQLFGLDK